MRNITTVLLLGASFASTIITNCCRGHGLLPAVDLATVLRLMAAFLTPLSLLHYTTCCYYVYFWWVGMGYLPCHAVGLRVLKWLELAMPNWFVGWVGAWLCGHLRGLKDAGASGGRLVCCMWNSVVSCRPLRHYCGSIPLLQDYIVSLLAC